MSALLTQLRWTNHLLIMSGSKSEEELYIFSYDGCTVSPSAAGELLEQSWQNASPAFLISEHFAPTARYLVSVK